MELVIKLYSDKPSKIGIRYTHEYKAIRDYEDLVSKYRAETFFITLELVKDKLTMVLTSKESGGKAVYKDLEFKKEQVERLRTHYTEGSPLEFVHVFAKTNTLLLAKPFHKAEFFKVSGFSIIAPGSPGY